MRPPAPVGPCAATNCSAALKAIDAECNVIGSGASHVLTSQFFENCDKAFQGLHAEELQYLNKDEQDLTRYQLLLIALFILWGSNLNWKCSLKVEPPLTPTGLQCPQFFQPSHRSINSLTDTRTEISP